MAASRLDNVISNLCARTRRLDAAEWRAALRAIGAQIEEELSTGDKQSPTLQELNASIKRGKERRKKGK